MLSNHALFCEGIESLLGNDAEMEFVGREANVDHGIKCIHDLRPDLVILDDDSPTGDTSLTTLVLQRILETEVIGLNLRENALYYRGEQKALLEPEDLRQTINLAHSKLICPDRSVAANTLNLLSVCK